jgi:hypothetical protein
MNKIIFSDKNQIIQRDIPDEIEPKIRFYPDNSKPQKYIIFNLVTRVFD